ncbi:mitogen-activated protein kinase kinase kinase 3-like [Phalaenopsis equestris]|uniref:mitogen-activated protein kinase kinase kinase 3-like n=1 Tax=Phalaenopsis equestris TaxID=78828 RepID=UPI0009E37E40|nr:mitogen-activated protein kinase kinase kinase 3-like [Phalaenopsis equestris]
MYNLFLEYVVGSCIFGALPEPIICRYVHFILFGLRHIDNMGYVHCDIKPDNILIVDGEAKITDFGLLTRVGEESTKRNIRGTPLYVAPKSASCNDYNVAADIWALGCSMSEMTSSRLPWRDIEDSNYGI